jgi:Flp pilus assembly protein TadB
MTAIIVLGVGFGIGLAVVVSALRPAPEPLGVALHRLHNPRPRASVDTTGSVPSLQTKLLGCSWEHTSLAHRLLKVADADLHITGVSGSEYLAQRLALAIAALLWAPLTAAIASLGGVRVPWAFPLWVSVAMVPVGFVLPGIWVRARATDRRRSFRHALSAFLDVVAVSLAGGQGIDSALHSGADAGNGWAFGLLRSALLEAQLNGEPPWAPLGRLGDRVGSTDLSELAASATLAGQEGARVRLSLAAKARALRIRGLTEIEAAARSASERMTLPIVALMVCFVLFIGYPAVTQVLKGL